jgi:ABC-type transport system involved in cytochrome c biogenesis ATPase subunit
LPADILDALDFSEPYHGHWPPATLDEALYVAGLAAESDNPLDVLSANTKRTRHDSAKLALDAEKLDELLAAAESARNELLSALEG